MQETQKTEAENTEDSLLKYHNFDAASIVERGSDEQFSWADEGDEDSGGQSSDSDTSSEDDEDHVAYKGGEQPDTKLFRQKKSDVTESSEGVVFGIDESFFQIGDMSDSDVSMPLQMQNDTLCESQ